MFHMYGTPMFHMYGTVPVCRLFHMYIWYAACFICTVWYAACFISMYLWYANCFISMVLWWYKYIRYVGTVPTNTGHVPLTTGTVTESGSVNTTGLLVTLADNGRLWLTVRLESLPV